ncbi:hypothetical protein RHGRI_032838 [Rhododendron griersonianum]|uniref:RING-type domain-containing protein n=1 Tax=Rhododendron griersonianum TaxID=479676 RepID=A0AAV6IJ45_9ERIC|nr:hypothetical protein RHGRI_032838 [Rhododendron griersonianum]
MGDTNSTKPQQEQPDDPFTCEICIEPMLSNNKKFRNNKLCVHPFCNECISSITEYAQFKNEEERVAGIKSPGSNCDKLLDPLTCPALVPPEVSDRCYCPNRLVPPTGPGGDLQKYVEGLAACEDVQAYVRQPFGKRPKEDGNWKLLAKELRHASYGAE